MTAAHSRAHSHAVFQNDRLTSSKSENIFVEEGGGQGEAAQDLGGLTQEVRRMIIVLPRTAVPKHFECHCFLAGLQ